MPDGKEGYTFYRNNLSVIASQCHCPGCGPNSDALFPPLAAVVIVATIEGRPWHSGKLNLFARGSPTRGAGGRKPD